MEGLAYYTLHTLYFAGVLAGVLARRQFLLFSMRNSKKRTRIPSTQLWEHMYSNRLFNLRGERETKNIQLLYIQH
jgi:hypothetical protein